jgi:NAD-dependent SIR2 family protein deacetylase
MIQRYLEKNVLPEKFFCRGCHAEITKEREESALSQHWIPLCEKCDPIIKEKFKIYQETWSKFSQSLAKPFRKK